ADSLARALVNQSAGETSLEARRAILAELRELRSAHPNNEEIAGKLAKALVNQSVTEAYLEPGIYILNPYPWTLHQLLKKSAVEARRAIVAELCKLQAAHPKNKEISDSLARAQAYQ
ncbi:MAG: hypothetical protein LBM75_02800, partial [Myxococcales bacterium]|nr:hypothetical protein [Myxococcales bacterium]